MTLTELKAQAARVFAEECKRYERKMYDHANDFVVYENDPFRDGQDIDLELFIGTMEDCDLLIRMRGLEAVWRFMGENWHHCRELRAADDIVYATGDEADSTTLVFAALGRQEG